MNKSYLGVLAAIIIGIATVVGAELAKHMHPILIIIFAYLMSAIILFPLSFLFREKIQIKELIKNKKDFIKIVLGRSIIGTIILIFGFSLTKAVHALFLLRTETIFVLIFSYFLLNEKITKKKLILIASTIIGSFLIITSGNLTLFSSAHIGDLLVILAMAIMSYTYIAAKNITQKVNTTTLTFSANLTAGIVMSPLLIFLTKNITEITAVNLYNLIAYALLFFVFGLYFFFKSIKHLKPWVVSSLLALELIVGVIFAIIWLKEPVTIVQWIGGAILLISSYFITKE